VGFLGLLFHMEFNDLVESYTTLLFSSHVQGVRKSNPEIPGGCIALVATNNNMVQEPPNSPGRMPVCLQNQVTFNKYILKN
jgi:hypothetical protein